MTLGGTETRFHVSSTDVPNVSPSGGYGWYTQPTIRRRMYVKTTEPTYSSLVDVVTGAAAPSGNTTGMIQFVSDPLPAVVIPAGVAMSGVFLMSSPTYNATPFFTAYIWRAPNTVVASLNSGTMNGTNMNTATPDTKLYASSTSGLVRTQAGDRLVVELGLTIAAGNSNTAVIVRAGNDPAIAEYSLTTGLITTLNPVFVFGLDLFQGRNLNAYGSVRVGDGMSASLGQ